MEHRARKRFGQNFLSDDTVVAQIVSAIRPQAEDHLVEIGPGLGALTIALLPYAHSLDVVELDRDLLPKLAERCARLGDVRIHNADALRFDFASLVKDQQALRIIGNLPYNISTPLLFHLLASKRVIRDMHFMLQKEVVERLAAQPGGKDYGRLSVMMQYHCHVESLFIVPPQAFDPAPKVESAVVRLIPHDQPPVEVMKQRDLETVVSRSFAMRRKTLRNNLKDLITAQQFDVLTIDSGRRAETLSLSEFAQLANALTISSENPA